MTAALPQAAAPAALSRGLEGYRPLPGVRDELAAAGSTEHASAFAAVVGEGGPEAVSRRQERIRDAVRRRGITFGARRTLNGVALRLLPVDALPRPVAAGEWARVERGLAQRVRALNAFLDDLYGEARILADGRVPAGVVRGAPGYRPALVGIRPAAGVRATVAGIDLVRGADGELAVLEDNLRVPSGAAYALEIREVMEEAYPGATAALGVRPVDGYPERLRSTVAASAPGRGGTPKVAVLTVDAVRCPAFFEDAALARWLGGARVRPHGLRLEGGRIVRRAGGGAEPVDVLYLRFSETALPPAVWKAVLQAWAGGTLTLVNAPGNGAADDKAVFAFVPEMIRYYLGEEPLLPQVATYLCSRADERAHVLAHLDALVVKRTDLSGGKGIVVGPQADRKTLSATAAAIRADPGLYVAQPLVDLSTAPVWTENGAEPRRVDLRAFVLDDGEPWVLPGGLTRVSGSPDGYVVNNSRGGGAKDTWVLGHAPATRRELTEPWLGRAVS